MSVVPSTLDLALYAGDGFALNLNVTDEAEQPLPVTGEVVAQIRDERNSVEIAAEFGVDQSTVGVVRLTLTGADTGALAGAGVKFAGVWDVQWTADSAEPLTLVQGEVTCEPDVSR